MLAYPSTAVVTRVAASATVVTLQAANTQRQGLIIFNDSATGTLYVKLGSGASATDFTYRLGPALLFETPAGIAYTGIVTGIWSLAVGAAQVTELSP